MPTAPVETRYTPEDLLAMSDQGRYELLDGQLVERNMGAESSLLAEELRRLLGNYVRPRMLGRIFGPDCGFQVFQSDPERVRFTDGAFIAQGRLPNDKAPKGHCRTVPDIAIEAVSPNDTASEVAEKVEEWLSAGVRLVWVIYPDVHQVLVHRGDGSATKLHPNDELAGEDVLPGFKCRVMEIFQVL